MQRTLSKQGARDTKLTVLIPASVMDDLRALRMYTCQSTGDLINQLIEREIESNPEAVEEGRRFLIMEQERQEQARARRESARRKEETPPAEAVEEAPEPESSEDAAGPETAEDPEDAVEEKEPEAGDPRTMITLEDVARWSQEGAPKEARRKLTDGEEFVKWLRAEGRTGSLKDAEDFAAIYRSLHIKRSKEVNDKHIGRIRSFVRWWLTQ